MSLLPSCNKGSATLDYAIANQGTAVAPVSAGVGSLSISPDGLGAAYVHTAAAGNTGSLHLGANPYTFDNIVLGSAPSLTTINTNAVCSQALTVGGAATFNGSATFNGAVVMSNTAPSLRTFTQAGGAYPSGGAGTALPQPGGLPAGLYSVVLQINDPNDNDYAVSALAYWNGTSWTGGGSASTIKLGGSTVAVINPANPATSLLYYHQKGSDLTVNFVYLTQLSAAF